MHDVFNLKVYNPINNHIIRLSSNKIGIKSERTCANALEVSHWNRPRKQIVYSLLKYLKEHLIIFHW